MCRDMLTRPCSAQHACARIGCRPRRSSPDRRVARGGLGAPQLAVRVLCIVLQQLQDEGEEVPVDRLHLYDVCAAARRPRHPLPVASCSQNAKRNTWSRPVSSGCSCDPVVTTQCKLHLVMREKLRLQQPLHNVMGECARWATHLRGFPSGRLPARMGRRLPSLAPGQLTGSGLLHPGDQMSLKPAERPLQLH